MGVAFLLMLAVSALAEDPYLGIIKGVKCVNCVPDSISLALLDPLNGTEVELMIPAKEYNALITPLPGKRIYDKDGSCFYWVIEPRSKEEEEAGPQYSKTCLSYRLVGEALP